MDHRRATTTTAAADATTTASKDELVQRLHRHRLLRERGRRIKAAAELGLARSSRGRQWGRALLRKVEPAAASEKVETKVLEGEEEEVVVVDGKVAVLRQLVPGGEEMAVERLLEETADYIAALRAQVGVMRALACLLSGLDALPHKAAGSLATSEKPR